MILKLLAPSTTRRAHEITLWLGPPPRAVDGVPGRDWTFLTSFKADTADPGTAQKQHLLTSVSPAPIASEFFEEGPNFIHV